MHGRGLGRSMIEAVEEGFSTGKEIRDSKNIRGQPS